MQGCQPTRRGVSILIRVERFKAPACGGAPLPHIPKLRETIRLGLAGRLRAPLRPDLPGHAQRGCRSPGRSVGCAATPVVPGNAGCAAHAWLRRDARTGRRHACQAPAEGSRQLELKGEPSCRPPRRVPAPAGQSGASSLCRNAKSDLAGNGAKMNQIVWRMSPLSVFFVVAVIVFQVGGTVMAHDNQIVNANIMTRVLHLKVGDVIGTGFTIEVDGRQYLITAKHLTGERDIGEIEIWWEQWRRTKVSVVGMGEGREDIQDHVVETPARKVQIPSLRAGQALAATGARRLAKINYPFISLAASVCSSVGRSGHPRRPDGAVAAPTLAPGSGRVQSIACVPPRAGARARTRVLPLRLACQRVLSDRREWSSATYRWLRLRGLSRHARYRVLRLPPSSAAGVRRTTDQGRQTWP